MVGLMILFTLALFVDINGPNMCGACIKGYSRRRHSFACNS